MNGELRTLACDARRAFVIHRSHFTIQVAYAGQLAAFDRI